MDWGFGGGGARGACRQPYGRLTAAQAAACSGRRARQAARCRHPVQTKARRRRTLRSSSCKTRGAGAAWCAGAGPCRPPPCPAPGGRGRRRRWRRAACWAAAGSPSQSCGGRGEGKACRGAGVGDRAVPARLGLAGACMTLRPATPGLTGPGAEPGSLCTCSPPRHAVQHGVAESKVRVLGQHAGPLGCQVEPHLQGGSGGCREGVCGGEWAAGREVAWGEGSSCQSPSAHHQQA